MEKKQISVQILKNEIVIENPPHNTKIEVYDIQNNCIYSGDSERFQFMRIQAQTEGTYIIKVGTEMLLSRQFWKTPDSERSQLKPKKRS